MEFSGVATTTPEDAFTSNDDIDTSGATDVSAGPITTTDAGDLILGSASDSSSDATLNFASPTSWTNKYRQNDSNTFIGHDSGYWLPAAIQTTYTAQWSHDNNASDESCGAIVALKPASIGSGAVSQPTMILWAQGMI
jgi:hypothetical protein